MKKLCFFAGILVVTGCVKKIDNNFSDIHTSNGGGSSNPTSQYLTYTIKQGAHFCDQDTIKSVTTSGMEFTVKFNNTAIYRTLDPENQYDINKLWGFSEGINNHYNSARIGWSWNNDSLRLYGYAYANGILYYQEVTPVTIGKEVTCSIKLAGDTYRFTVNGVSISLPRGPSASQASGYQQYPYFGGDEVAPHLITILIKNLSR